MMDRFKLACCAALLALGSGGTAHAQEVDYGALEQMFGQPVTTSATGSPQLASQAPADMQIISADDIRRSGATNIPDILNFVAGVDVRQDSAIGANVAIRGFNQNFNPRLLVLVDGRQVYLDDYGYVAWQAIPVQLSEIRQIEIVRGPAAALFGFNAVSGVINIITYAPITDKINQLTFGYGTDGTLLGDLVTTAQDPGKGGVRISLGGLKTNEFSESPAIVGPFGEAHPSEGSFGLNGQWKPSATTDISLGVTDSGASSFFPTNSANRSVYRVQSVKFAVSADTGYGLATLQAYTNRSTSKFNFAEAPYGQDIDNQITVIQANDLIKFANVHAIRLGLEFRANREWGAVFGSALSYKDYAADAMWNWQITPLLSLTNAGRIDHLGLSYGGATLGLDPYSQADYDRATITATSFNSGLVYQPTSNDTFRLLIGQGPQAPSLLDFGVQTRIPYGPYSIGLYGNPDLKPTTVTNYEADYDRLLPALNATLSTALYYQLNRDFLVPEISAPVVLTRTGLQAQSRNIGNATAAGGEFGIQGASPSGWRWNLSYSLFTAHQDILVTPPAGPDDFTNGTPTSEVDFALGYGWNQWEADLQGKYQSRYTDVADIPPVYVTVPIRNFVTLNARIGYHVTRHLTLAVTGDELTAPRLTETADLPPDRRVLFTAAYVF